MLEQYAYVAQILGVLVVGATLIYLAIQTKQNTDAVQASSRHTVISSDMSVLQLMMDHPAAIASMAEYKADMPLSEKVQLETWLVALARTREHHWLQHKSNLLDTKTMEAFLTGLTLNISFPISRKWWNEVAHDYFDSDFVDDINGRLSMIPIIDNWVHPFDR